MPLMGVSSGRLWSRASRWGKAGSDVRLEWLHVESSVCIDEEWLAATHVRLEGLVE